MRWWEQAVIYLAGEREAAAAVAEEEGGVTGRREKDSWTKITEEKNTT